jgi:hypothetical protein
MQSRPNIRSNKFLRRDIQTQMFNSLRNKASWVIDALCSTDRSTITFCVHNVLPPARQPLNCTPYCCNGRISEGIEVVRIAGIDLYLYREACNQYMLTHKSEWNFLEIIYFTNIHTSSTSECNFFEIIDFTNIHKSSTSECNFFEIIDFTYIHKSSTSECNFFEINDFTNIHKSSTSECNFFEIIDFTNIHKSSRYLRSQNRQDYWG